MEKPSCQILTSNWVLCDQILFTYVGLIDPMTGEGIHTAMESGKIAASVLEDAFTVGNFDSAVLEEYQNKWLNSFGTDYYWYAVVMEIAIRLCKLVVRLQSAKLV